MTADSAVSWKCVPTTPHSCPPSLVCDWRQVKSKPLKLLCVNASKISPSGFTGNHGDS